MFFFHHWNISWHGYHGYHSHMRTMVLVYANLHNWVILFGQMLVNIPAPWFAYGIVFCRPFNTDYRHKFHSEKNIFLENLDLMQKGLSLIGLDGDIAKENGDKLFRILPPMAHWSNGGRSRSRKPQILSNGGWFKQQHCWWKHGSFHHSTWQRRKNMGIWRLIGKHH